MNRIRYFLESYQDLWWVIDQSVDTLPCMDVVVDINEDTDFYRVDFSGEQMVCTLFFTGCSNYFPAIWIGNNNSNDIDKYPIFVIDCSSSTDEFESEGNFRNYIDKILTDFLIQYNKRDDFRCMALAARRELENFSSDVIGGNIYKLKKNDY